MKWLIIRRLLMMIVAIWGVTVLVFTLIQLAPGDPAEVIAIARYGIDNLSEQDIEHIRQQEHLDSPIYVQYGEWLNHVVHGDLGRSVVDGESVSSEIWRRFPTTLQLTLASMIIALIISIPLGIISSVKQNSLFDHFSMTGALIGVSMPNFWLGLLLILIFSVHLGWLPVFGRGGIDHLILPALTLGTGMAAITTRLIRSSMLEVLGQNYIRTARAKGLPEYIVIGKHALKNAFIPVITIIGLQFAFLLEGAVIVETIFAWPGIGRLLIDAIFSRDFAMIQGCALFVAIVFAIVNLTVDIAYAWLDPRIRFTGRPI